MRESVSVIGNQNVPSATIKIFLPHGDPKRLRTAELSNWSGKAVAGPRSEFDGLLARDESDSSGVYILAGSDPEAGKPALYIGEAEYMRERIKAHLKTDFWNQVVFFVSKDENLTKSYIRYLEGKLIEQAHRADRAVVKNSQSSGSKLPEADRADMDVFLEKIRQFYAINLVSLVRADLTPPPWDEAVHLKDSSNMAISAFQESIDQMHALLGSRIDAFKEMRRFDAPDGSTVTLFKRIETEGTDGP